MNGGIGLRLTVVEVKTNCVARHDFCPNRDFSESDPGKDYRACNAEHEPQGSSVDKSVSK